MKNEDLQLLEQYLDGTLSAEDILRLETLLRESQEARATLRTLATLDLGLSELAAGQSIQNETPIETRSIPSGRTTSGLSSTSWTRSLLAVAVLAIIGLGTTLWFQTSGSPAEPANGQSSAGRMIAKVTGAGGEIFWTGNDGIVTTDLESGSSLTGGTIEGTSPTSWVELEFLDGSRITVAGDSRLTFSDFGQKVLHLKKGSVSSSVEPQELDAPMLVYSRNAMLEVLGTEFKFESEVDVTTLNVTEGKVRFKRLSDGQTVEVSANHEVRSSDGISLTPQPIPTRASQWKSNLNQPYGTHGKWLPGTESLRPRLKLVHYCHKTPEGESFKIRNAGMAVLGKDGERVDLPPGSKIRVRGYAKENQKTVFGVVVRNSNGNFGGYYSSSIPNTYWMSLQTKEQGERSGNLQPFEVVVDVADLVLGPDLQKAKHNFAATPVGLVVDWVFFSTPAEESGLEITEVEIFRSEAD